MRCFTACLGTWKHKEIKKNVQEQSLSSSYEPVESLKLLNATSESVKEDEVVFPGLEFEAKTQKQMKCSNENKAALDHPKTETFVDKLSTTINHILVQNENVNVKREEEKDDRQCVTMPMNSNESAILEESSESLFSLSIDSRKQVYALEMGDKEVSSIPKNSPIETENKSSSKYDDDQDKENIVNLDENRIMFLGKEAIQKPKDKGIVCDTSLSSWLVESEKSFQKGSVDGNSPESEKNYGERRILGEVTRSAELEFQLMNASSSVGTTPSCSGDDQPSIGTVGRFWLAGKVDVGLLDRGVSTVLNKA